MDANYLACLQFILHGRGAFKGEAGLVHAPGDPGGWTNKGITLATLSKHLGRPATVSELARLTDTIAGQIYSKEYWAPIGAGGLPRGVDLIAMDVSVNAGPKRATEFLTKTVGLSPVGRVHAIDRLRVGWWHVCRDWPLFGKGWMSRENACLAYALEMAGG